MRAILGLAIILLLAGCRAAADKDGGDPLAGTAWALAGLAGQALPPAVAVTARFHEGRIGGSAGCNEYSASYAVEGDSLRVGPAGATKKMCPDPQMAVERAFLAALPDLKSFALADGRLRLWGAGGDTLTFAAAPFAAADE